jgi:hypothetical protein
MKVQPIVEAAPPIADRDFAAAHQALLGDHSIQFDLPQIEIQPPPEWLLRGLGGLGPIAQALFWVIAGAVILAVVYLIARWASGAELGWGKRKHDEDDESWRPAEAPARQLLGEADALAGQGLFSEAARLLLFRSIEDIDTRRPDLVRPALTSRDIAGLPAIPDRPRSAFSRIAMLVERSLFAARPLAEADWRDCRSAYEDFAFAEGWRG